MAQRACCDKMTWAGLTSLFRWRVTRVAFTRITSTGEYIPQIDGLRFLAMLLVLAHHAFAGYLVQTHRLGTQELPRDWALIAPRSALIPWALHLQIGVQLFFAISGFVLTIPFARGYLKSLPPPSRRAYLLRRLVRLEPPYILNLIFLFLVIVIPWGQKYRMAYLHSFFHAFFPHLLASLVYLHAAVYADASWINGVAWTLEVEIQFYLLLPILAELFRIRRKVWRRAILFALVLGSSLISQFVFQPSGNARLNLSLAIQLQFFMTGLLLADVYLDPPQSPRLGPRLADALAILGAALLVFVLHWEPRLAWTEAFLIGLFCCGVFYGAWTSRVFRSPVLTILGGMSYTIYLYHFFIIDQLLPLTVRLFPPVHSLWWDASVQFGLMLAPVFGISALIFLIAERPFMILSRDVSRRVAA
jgi:peptidoglycan/LPS O-acetylase OafA/YrhL